MAAVRLPSLAPPWPMRAPRSLLSLALLLVLADRPAHAFESDQVTSRQDPPTDARLVANAHANALLWQAAVRTNRLTRCALDDARTQEELARQVHRAMGGREYVPARGNQPPMGFGAYAAWLETGPVDRDSHAERDDLYAGVKVGDSLILAAFGPSSTVALGPWLVGTDKIDHFWIQGYDYFRRSREGRMPSRAVDWGTRTERGIWGLRTTGVFSYADLAANYDGMHFYTGLLGPGSVLQRDAQGCVVLDRAFDWAEWVDWRYDEVLNPSVYKEGMADALLDGLAESAPWFCAEGLSPVEPVAKAPWVGRGAPFGEGYFDLADLCRQPALASSRDRRSP